MAEDDNLLKTLILEEDESRYDDDDDEDLALLGLTLQTFQAEGSQGSRRRGSIIGHRVIDRDHAGGHARIIADYFVQDSVYTEYQFRRRYRMRRHVFQRIMEVVQEVDPWFQQRPDACGKPGLSALQKMVAAVRILAYGLPADAVDEYVRIGEATANQALARFCRALITAFEEVYLKAPTAADVAALLQVGESRGFPGMLGSIDCMHWEWRNCPNAWKGMFTGRGKLPSMILEAVASYDLWIWHAYFGMPGSNNDINVLHRSPIFASYVRGEAPPIEYTVNDHTYTMGYYLADGIYPDWPTFVKSVRHPLDRKDVHFARVQEGAHKDIERAFGVLQSRWAIVRGPAYGWKREQLKDIMTACIIMHNMIIEDERGTGLPNNFDNMGTPDQPFTESTTAQARFVAAYHRLRDRAVCHQLKRDLIEHNWMLHGGQ